MTNTSRPMVRIHNSETDELIDREMTDAEFKEFEKEQMKEAEQETLRIKAAENKAALLTRLGLTEAELQTILG